MSVYGNMYTQKIACANNGNAQQNFDSVVSTEKLVKITPTTNVYVLFTPITNTHAADNSDYFIPANQEREFPIGRGLDRLAIRNESGGAADIHVAILF
jgi:hypothetical protein